MTQENHLENLKEIRSLMERSSRFISLSGLSGVIAGVWALIGAAVAYKILFDFYQLPVIDNADIESLELTLIAIALIVLIGAIGSAFFFTLRKAKKDKTTIWNKTTKKMALNLAIPLFTGGVVALFMIFYELYVFVAPFTLIFYGLSCVNASHNTVSDIRFLGVTIILVGLVNLFFLGHGLYFWAFGFGILHIVYGTMMYFKYEK